MVPGSSAERLLEVAAVRGDGPQRRAAVADELS